MEDIAAYAEKHAESMTFALDHIGSDCLLQLRLVTIVIFDGRDIFIQGDVKVVVEIAAVGRIPGNSPAVQFLVGCEFGKWSTGDQDERGVAIAQPGQITMFYLLRSIGSYFAPANFLRFC